MKLIAGLGNPGKEYALTRHNAGFMALDRLAAEKGFSEFKKDRKHNAEIAEGEIAGQKVLLMKPQTFMNLSGEAVRSVSDFYKIPPADMVVIYDEVDLPLGTLRVRPSGSAGGHNGIKSLIQSLGTEDFARIRIGIKPIDPFPGDLADYVLGKLTEDDKNLLEPVLQKISSAVQMILEKGIDESMRGFN